ncbi:hypothetical protein A3D71_00890 [Candidatus Kaiserbacteria bacterium RIFCSPHIGHO2_02_FULL_55_20]|uniref:Uncharacterized protein n=1 Tax=Candidatus Kaiserbacteria bacterium RIFCSPHIGHO2_02_FULL_55_20 TaxID=1798497 RepID=A0A1F6DWK0_9BACT|nr:MAG: hypothetical protein A3D71_00890 [Candidatus Kaiserbacteria bacterium RIFCSPHIGHO2_02_FULL_55_20]
MYSQANTAGMKSALLIALMAACFTLPSIVHAQAPPGGGDGGMPTFEAPRASEGTVTAGEINSSNTGVILNVPVPDDAVYEGGSLQPEVSQDDGLTFFSVGTPHTITNAELGTAFDLAAISISSIESALGNVLSDGMTLTFREVTTDSEGTVHDAVALGQLLVNMPPDTTAPVIAAHEDVTAEATSASGAVVSYTSPAADDGSAVTCLPASGGTFAVGATMVTCNASDGAGNAATASPFTVRVADTPVASPDAGTYTSAQSVTLSAEGSPSIRYTTDGSTPTCAGSTYSSAISVGSSVTVKALSCYGEGGATASSSVASFDYTINIPAPAPAPAPSGGGGGGSAGGDGHSLFPVAPVVGVVTLPAPPAPVVSETNTVVVSASSPVVSAAPAPSTQRPAPHSVAPVAVAPRAATNEVGQSTEPVETEIGVNSSQAAAAGAPQREKIQWGPQVTTVDYGIGQLIAFFPWFVLFVLLLIILLSLFKILRTSNDFDTEYSEPRL